MSTNNWGAAAPQQQDGGQDSPVSLLLVHRDIGRTTAWYQALLVDARFRVSSMANDVQDFRSKLVSSPEVILMDATVFDGPKSLAEALSATAAAVYLILPPSVKSEMEQELRGIPAVKDVFPGDVNIADFQNRAYATAISLRRTVPSVSQTAWAGGRSGGSSVGGLRIITAWSRSGGTGKSTIASALAQAVARKQLKSLLIGLGSPDILPLILGLQPEPNITTWIANPSDEGLQASVQKLGDLHVVSGFPDIISESHGDRPAEQKGSVGELVTSAAYSGYASIILDTPSAGIAPRAISAANTWLMVARPTIADAWSCVESFRMVTQRSAGQHRIVPGNIFVVLNQRTNGMMTADEWHRTADSACRKMGLAAGFPPVVSVVPYVPEVGLAQDNGRSALDASDEFARPIHRLADMLFGGAMGDGQSSSNQRDAGNVIKLGPLKIRTK
jgi:arsenite/tail-anchored protein-transporting ATPase